ncbi:MAG: hydroxymethylbilane synthase [Alphaproteobacteria bacterium]|nr:hydroxymethylbilane synthase [Alphaproteobacteria bacterium]
MVRTQPEILWVGTRCSILAVCQAERAISALSALEPDTRAEIVKITTAGDVYQKGSLADIGGKGLFVKEIDNALLNEDIDFGVHSLKDLENALPDGIVLAAVLPRDDARDAFLGQSLQDLPRGARVGTCSVRRAAQVLMLRPDLEIVPMRGNVQTRLRKLKDGSAEASLLSYAGLQRLGLEHKVAELLALDSMIPAVGQGVIALCARSDDTRLRTRLKRLSHRKTEFAIIAERAMLAILDGSCHTPIGGYAHCQNGMLKLSAILLSLDGTRVFRHNAEVCLKGEDDQAHDIAKKLGQDVAAVIKQQAGDILADTALR